MIKKNYEIYYILIITIIIFLYYLYLNLSYIHNPINSIGWNGWFDQSKYHLSAISIYEKNWDSDKHWYPIGYSAISSIFVGLNYTNPFIYTNSISFILYCYFYLKYFNFINIYLRTFSLLAGLFIFKKALNIEEISPVIESFIIPWNTVVISAAYLAIISYSEIIKKNTLVIGLICGLVISVRMIDFIPLAFFLVTKLLYENDDLKIKLLLIFKIFLASLNIIIPFLIINKIIHGNIVGGSYVELSNNIGLGFDNLINRFYWIAINSKEVWNDGNSLIEIFPFLILAPFALIYLAYTDYKKYLPLIILILVSFLMYLSYNDFSPHNIFRFKLVHYISWMIPILFLMSLVGFFEIINQKKYRLLILIGLIIFSLSKLNINISPNLSNEIIINKNNIEIKFSSESKINGIDLKGIFINDWMKLTTTDIKMNVNGRDLHVFSGYKLTPTNTGIRIIFNKNIKVYNLKFSIESISGTDLKNSITVMPVYFLYSF
jgi:hypothetical protein